jgi:hypothetical protein
MDCTDAHRLEAVNHARCAGPFLPECSARHQAVPVQGVFFGLGQMQGLGLQHLHGMGFIMAKLEAPDGLPIFSAPSYIEIVSTRAGVGAGVCLLTA